MGNNFENKVQTIKSDELNQIKKDLMEKPDVFVVEIQGATIQSWEDYILEIQTKFKFPTSCLDSMDRYEDWIRDLSWLEKEEYVLIINQYQQLLSNDQKLKEIIISSFVDTVLPFWQEEVERVVVEGKAKSFMIYLVN
jgi:hypothetical protein